MKDVLNLLAPAIIAVFICISASSVPAQNNCEKIYDGIKTGYHDKRPLTEQEMVKTLDLVKKFIADPACKTEEYSDIRKFLEGQIPKFEARLKSLKDVDSNPFNESIPSKNWDKAFASGKEIIAKFPDTSVDVMLVLASVGFDLASAKPANDKYNDDTLNFSKTLIQNLEADMPSQSGNYGAFEYIYKNKDYPDGRANALGWMNYNIGYIMYERRKDRKGALPYLYKATQFNSATKSFSIIYKLIGDWYMDEFKALEEKRRALAPGDANKAESKDLWALQKGYADRAAEAYARAYNIAIDSEATPAYKPALYKRLTDAYAIRFDDLSAHPNDYLDGLNEYIKSTIKKPFTDPLSPVSPAQ